MGDPDNISTDPGPTGPHLGVIGAGYVGLTTGACFASMGHRVTCADIDAERVDLLRAGRIPIVEDGLQEIVTEVLGDGRLDVVLGARAAAEQADIVFLCVPTPQGEDGSADLSYIRAAAAEIGPVLRSGAIVVNKSTVPVGSAAVVEKVIEREDIAVVSNPEFLREGTAVFDFLNPDRVVIGASDRTAGERVAKLYDGIDTQIMITDPASAETIKYAANGFLAMKISFANAVAAMCEAVGADVAAVLDGIGSDDRIGRQFLAPGPGWGGSCFPKDSRALVKIAEDHGYNFSMMRGVIEVNDEQRTRIIAKIRRALGRERGGLEGATIGALGLTFKAGTDDLRESPGLRVIDALRRAGATVRAYDPTTTGDVTGHRAATLEGIELVASAVDVADGADTIVLFTEWPEFRELPLAAIAERVGRPITVVDTRNLLEADAVRAAGLGYEGVGRH
jgi:UDPglucose 6-dehydrogenase